MSFVEVSICARGMEVYVYKGGSLSEVDLRNPKPKFHNSTQKSSSKLICENYWLDLKI